MVSNRLVLQPEIWFNPKTMDGRKENCRPNHGDLSPPLRPEHRFTPKTARQFRTSRKRQVPFKPAEALPRVSPCVLEHSSNESGRLIDNSRPPAAVGFQVVCGSSGLMVTIIGPTNSINGTDKPTWIERFSRIWLDKNLGWCYRWAILIVLV